MGLHSLKLVVHCSAHSFPLLGPLQSGLGPDDVGPSPLRPAAAVPPPFPAISAILIIRT